VRVAADALGPPGKPCLAPQVAPGRAAGKPVGGAARVALSE